METSFEMNSFEVEINYPHSRLSSPLSGLKFHLKPVVSIFCALLNVINPHPFLYII